MENQKISKPKALLNIIIVLLVFFGIITLLSMILMIFYIVNSSSPELILDKISALSKEPLFYFYSTIAQNIITIISVIIFVKGSFKERFKKLKLNFQKGSLKLFGTGCIAAILAILLVLFLGIITGITKYEGIGFSSSYYIAKILILSLITCLFVGFGEEILFRGYIYGTLAKSGTNLWAIPVSAVIFMLMHIGTYSKPLDFIDVFCAGILLAFMYIKSKSLYLSIGFHFIWDFTQLSIFRLEKSAFFGDNYIFKFKVPNDIYVAKYDIGCKYELIFIAVVLILIFLVSRKSNKTSETI